MMTRPLALAALCASIAACGNYDASPRDGRSAERVPLTDRSAPWAAPSIERSTHVLDGRTGATLTLEQMLDRLAEADAVFIGEVHTDETTHRFQLAVYEGLLERRAGRVVLAMEMFERDVQPVLDAYVASEISEAEFLSSSRPWGQYTSAYRPLIEAARSGRHPVVASNMPRPLAREISSGGLGALDELAPDRRAHAPAQVLSNTEAYHARVDNATRGHLAMMRRSPSDDRRSSTQTLWDNTMAESCAIAMETHPGSAVLHINGGFHSAYWDGTVQQLQLRRPDARILTIDVRPTRNPAIASIGDEPVADFVVYAERRASDAFDGAHSVAFDRTLEYVLHLPEGASAAAPVPLVIWLGRDGLRAEDGMDLWKRRLGDEAAIAVIDPPYRWLAHDLSDGGQWFWPDSFSADVGSLVSSLERVWGYLLRHHPIDPTRVVIAGEGTGATVAVAAGLFSGRMSPRVLAFGPARYAPIKDLPLPIGSGAPNATRIGSRVTVSVDDTQRSFWEREFDAYATIGASAALVEAPKNDPTADASQERMLRSSLGLSSTTSTAGATIYLRPPSDSPRALHWSRLYGLNVGNETGRSVKITLSPEVHAETIELSEIVTPANASDAIPRCPGPFGGTTVLVVPDDATDDERSAWLAIESNDPLSRASRFHRTRVARTDAGAGDRSLVAVLEKLESQNRKNVLIVPATFHAGADRVRQLERATRHLAERMTLRWSPGLGGGELPVVTPATNDTAALGNE
ncbi:MAG: ChaN family lipoprotein [Planctomycetota bacterium]